MERAVLKHRFPVWDLQRQTFWLVARPEDNNVSHNAYDEVRFLFVMIMYDIDPQNITWHDANKIDEKREIYDELLQWHGYLPISKKGTCSVIHVSSDWTIGLRSQPSHVRDIQSMKWKLYQLCLHKTFNKTDFQILERYVSLQLDEKWKSVFDSMDLSNLPFPKESVAGFSSYFSNV